MTDWTKLRNHRMERIGTAHTTDAAVLVPLVKRDGHRYVLFEVRSANVAQGGEICFPGGAIEPTETPEAAALRETTEELLLPSVQVRPIAPLFTMTGPGGRAIYSYAGEIEDYGMTWARAEVERVFLLPLKELLAMRPRVVEGAMTTVLPEHFPYHLIPQGRDYPFRSIPRTFYFYETPEGVIWGMTATLLYHFLELVRE